MLAPSSQDPLPSPMPLEDREQWRPHRAGNRRGRHFSRRAKQFSLAFLTAAVLLLVNDFFVYESVLIPSSSMRPTVLPNERVFVRKFGFGPPNRFDVVVVQSPAANRRLLKRVIGLPGERVRVEDGWRVVVNGTPLTYSDENAEHFRVESGHHSIQLAPGNSGALGTMSPEIVLGPDEYFLLGDNRLASEDSRVVGPVKDSAIQGKATWVWYSYDLQIQGIRWSRLGERVR